MEFEDMTVVWQDRGCVGGNCEAVYRVPGGVVVQGKRLGPDATARLTRLGADETALFLTPEAVRQALLALGN